MPSGGKKSPVTIFDLLVIGLGPAGVSCVLQASREKLRIAAVSDQPVGGLVRAARRLDNLPGLAGVSGRMLASRLEKQVRESGARLFFEQAARLRKDTDLWHIGLVGGRKLLARAVVLASGTVAANWEFSLPGVHRDITTLPRRLSCQPVAVIGGGEAALDTALSCRDRGAQVVVLARAAQLGACSKLLAEAERARIKIFLNAPVVAVEPQENGFRLETGRGRFFCRQLAVCIGRRPRRELLDGLGMSELDELERAGIFLAGDLVRGRDRYAAAAMGDGQRAALHAVHYLRRCLP